MNIRLATLHSTDCVADGEFSSRRAVLLVNPHAGGGRARRHTRVLVDVAREAGWHVEVRETLRSGDESRIAAEVKSEGWPLLIAVGGDGTAHGAANGLLRHGPATTVLAHVPVGTGNDYAKVLGLRGRRPRAHLRRILGGRIRTLDVGLTMNEYFVNSFGIGFSAEVAQRALELKHLRGFPAYLAATYRSFFSFEAPRMQMSMPNTHVAGRWLMVEVAIGQTAGGGFKLTPNADPADGLLDICIIDQIRWWTFLRYLPSVVRGTHGRLKWVHLWQGARLTLIAEAGPPLVHLDGEVRHAPTSEVDIQILPNRLPVLCAA